MDERTKRRLYASPLMSMNIKTALLTKAIDCTFPYIKYFIPPLNKYKIYTDFKIQIATYYHIYFMFDITTDNTRLWKTLP